MTGPRVLVLTVVAFALVCALGLKLLPAPAGEPPLFSEPAAAAVEASAPQAGLEAGTLPQPKALGAEALAGRDRKRDGGRGQDDEDDEEDVALLDVPEAARPAVRALRPHLLGCFEDLRERATTPEEATVAFTLAPGEGRAQVREARVVAVTARDPSLEACLVDTMEEVPLPSPAGAVALQVQHRLAVPAPTRLGAR